MDNIQAYSLNIIQHIQIFKKIRANHPISIKDTFFSISKDTYFLAEFV